MTEREKIIELAKDNGCNFPLRSGFGNCLAPQFFSQDDLIKFYHAAIAEFLTSSGQYVTNDASREACIKQAQNEAYETAAVVCEAVCEALASDDVPCGLGGKEIAIVIRGMKK